MPTFQNPTADAAEASEALRGLAHATRVFEDPADTYAVLGDLLAGVGGEGVCSEPLSVDVSACWMPSRSVCAASLASTTASGMPGLK